MMKKNNARVPRSIIAIIAAVSAALIHLQCGTAPLSGGGSDTEVSGRMVAAGGAAAAGAIVALVDTGYDPAFGLPLPQHWFDTTDAQGNYRFTGVPAGAYNLCAEDRRLGVQSLVNGLSVVTGQETRVSDAVLKPPAFVRIFLPDTLASRSGKVSVPGTMLQADASGLRNFVEFSAVPQAVLTSIRFREQAGDAPVVLYSGVAIDSAGLFVLDPFMGWQHEAAVSFNTTPSGANVTETVLGFPALLRLTSAELDFSQARREGEDLRFVRNDNTLVPFEIEYWDSATSTAVIWVRLDTVAGNSSAQSVRMLWGNPAAKKTSYPARVFDTAQGFQGVWHLGESGPNPKLDATANGFTGTPVELDGSSDVDGMAGRGLDFDGSSQCVTVLNARDSKLDVQADSFYTVSVWASSRNTQRDNRVIVSKGSAQYGLMQNDQNQWEFYGGLRGYGVDTTTTAGAAVNVWTLLTGVRRGMRQYLYVNGVLADSSAPVSGVSASISTNYYDLTIGRQSDDESQWFDGLLDEIRVENRARPAAWIRLCHENQRTGQLFVQVRKVR